MALWSWIDAACPRWVRGLVDTAWLAWRWFVAHARFHARKAADASPWSIVRVLAINDRTNEFCTVPVKEFDPQLWELALPSIEPDDGWRLEVRYVHTSKFGRPTKFRMVLRPGDTCTFPPPAPTLGLSSIVTKATMTGGVRGILRATLMPLDGHDSDTIDSVVSDVETDDDHEDEDDGEYTDDGSENVGRCMARAVDITARFKKYLGPGKDFHGNGVRPLDLFPYDDPDSLDQRFAGVQVTDIMCRSTLYDFRSNRAMLM